MRTFWKIALLLLISSYAYAENDAVKNEVFDNISHEFVACACYFSIVSQAMSNAGDKQAAEKYEQASDTALNYAVMAAQENRSNEMVRKVTLARFELGLKSMFKEIDNNVSNISILMNKYGFRCKDARWRILKL
jgi:hypothetical protein